MRQNNFDIVRLLLASIVVLVHSYSLSDRAELVAIPHLLSSRLAVEGFFAISGFLIFSSYERCTSLKEYFTNRAFRILPGYWLSTVFCLVIALAVLHFDLSRLHAARFLLANLTFLNFLGGSIPGVFDNNPLNSAMNGALWTIKIEVMFYLAVPLIVWLCRRWNRDLTLLLIFVLSLVYRVTMAYNNTLAVQLPGQLSYFVTGALIYYHLPFFKRHGRLLMLAAAVVFGLHTLTGWFILRPAPVAMLTLGACLLAPHIHGPTRWGDFSYGTYVLHYPIVQLVVASGFYNARPWPALALTVLLVACAAVFSWFIVEKPSLAHAKSRRLRQSALGHTANFPSAVP